MLANLGLPVELLPKVAQPGTMLGRIKDEELRRRFSLAQTKVIHTASHDTAAAVLSVPHEEQDYVYISSGTWSLIGTVVERPFINEITKQFNLTNEGGVGNYRLLKNVMGLWLVQETQRALQAMNEPYEIERLVHRAKLAAPFTYLFNPDDTRLLQPKNMPETIRQICRETNQRDPEDTGELIRGIFESLALKYRQVLEELELVTGRRYNTIHIVGGGSQNQLLSQFTANATQRIIVTGPVEASAMGNALGQLMALGEVSSPGQMAQLVGHSLEPVSYSPRDKAMWDSAYENFKRISAQQAQLSMSI
ncbi:rhamnulokinase [Alicyclobacillus mengziensis]|uniref:Carbohydrate kinase FGGY C-terminal domain-containing protein n=1 Tax=Alicyclobacillus mengziensis TaxID=2931921 RepID=A0A9X7Z7N1_9BACL|nr:FGGY-family carbohydrate kinase [Alicyclobacillus mengziensis]QSO49264.1 hypothetical protein JZ786_10280 [Alicyclobacillus mengziensis]